MKLDQEKDQRRLYDDLAWIWPIISPPEEYRDEAEEFKALIHQHSASPARTLLHLGTGGGHLDSGLKDRFQVTGVDISPKMLDLARDLNPKVRYLAGDMRTFKLKETFDAVIIADSIDYMLSEPELMQAFRTAYSHLKPGGVFCTYAEETTDRFQQNKLIYATHAKGEIEITSIDHYHDPNPTDTTYEMTFLYLIRDQGALSVQWDRHVMGIFPVATWIDILEAVGFSVQVVNYQAAGPMFVCQKS